MNYELGNFSKSDGLGQSTSSSSLTEAKNKVDELTMLQKRVDQGLKNMPDSPDKQRLLKIRDQSRGIFSKYIMPAWNRIRDMMGNAFGEVQSDEEMGVIPLIPIAAATAATAMLGYVTNSIFMERRILNDSSFTAAQKTQILSGGGLKSLVGITTNLKVIAVVAVIGYVALRYFAQRQKAD